MYNVHCTLYISHHQYLINIQYRITFHISEPDCCNGKAYDHLRYLCCNNRLLHRPANGACCYRYGSPYEVTTYNTNTQVELIT